MSTLILRWGVERRMAFLEARLFWDGEVSRGDLMDRFGVSVAQASGDIARYTTIAPDNLAYDKTRKRYVPTATFLPRFGTPDAAQYLSELQARAANLLHESFATPADLPPTDLVPIPARTVDSLILRSVVQAVRHRRRLDVQYQSFTKPHRRRRQIEPHALAHDGQRWHARAFDPELREFRDFVLGRIYEAAVDATAASSTATQDAEWQQMVALSLKPNPRLSPDQMAAVRHDYGFRGGTLDLTIRRAFVFYVKRNLRLDIDPATVLPQHQHLILVSERDL